MVYFVKKFRYVIIVACFVLIGIFFFNRNPVTDIDLEMAATGTGFPETAEMKNESTFSTVEENVVVDIKGAVQNPGVYDVQSDTRIVDVIALADGFTKNADEKQVNLAQRVHDEMLIYIPKIGEKRDAIASVSTEGSDSGDKVRINQATQAELETLTGIGPGKAQAILDHIQENGPFMEVDDLLAVGGIGEKTLEKFRENIIIP